MYGIAEPVRRGMELKMVREGCWRPDVLGRGAGVHEEILMLGGRETEIGWEDVYSGMFYIFTSAYLGIWFQRCGDLLMCVLVNRRGA